MNIINSYHLQGNFDREVVIVVEGADDIRLIGRILEEESIPSERVGLLEIGGIPNLKAKLSLLRLSSPYRSGLIVRVALVLDADSDPEGRVREVATTFRALGWPEVNSNKSVECDDGRILSLFLLPDGVSSGDLEHLLLSAAVNDKVKNLALAYIDECKRAAKEAGRQLLGMDSKRISQAYLAGVSKELCRGVGMAAAKGDAFDLSAASVLPLRKFLLSLIA